MIETISSNNRQKSESNRLKSSRVRQLSTAGFGPAPLNMPSSRVASEDLHSADEMQAVLQEHVMDCRHCLAMALFRSETLAEVGCEEYKDLLASIRSLCRVQGFHSPANAALNTADEHSYESVLSH